jgi:hypothetical protein
MANSVTISDDADDAESADYFVCILATDPTAFTDNVFDFCCKCGVKVQHRPHGPTVPKRICISCAMPGLERDAAKGELEVMATSRTAQEVAAHFRKRSLS